LLQRRATLVQARVALQQSLADLPGLKQAAATLFRQLKRIDLLIQKGLVDTLTKLDWNADFKRCQGIEGVGPLTSAALTMSFHRGAFRSSDAFVAFLGLDVRVRDSGQLRGRRRLTKKGNPSSGGCSFWRPCRPPVHAAGRTSIKDISTGASPEFRPW
jgi:transposase